jgi:hypothetical protein
MSGARIEAATTTNQAIFMRTPLATRLLVASLLTSKDREPFRQISPRVGDFQPTKESRSLEEVLFDNAAALKIAFAEIAMYLSPEWRRVIFKQLDRLLDPASWEDESALIARAPFMTFLRFVIYAAPTRFPSLGVSQKGHILAAWLCPPQQIAVEFLADDKAAATFLIQTARSKEIIAWRGYVADLKDFIRRNDLSACIGI